MTPIIVLLARRNKPKPIDNYFTAYEDLKNKFGEDDWRKGYYMEPDPYDPINRLLSSSV